MAEKQYGWAQAENHWRFYDGLGKDSSEDLSICRGGDYALDYLLEETTEMSTFAKHKSYRVRKHCKKCAHVLVIVTEADDLLYCHKDKAKRPPCPWGIFDMTAIPPTDREARDRIRKREAGEWNTWSGPRHVEAAGICDDYVKRLGPYEVAGVGPEWG